MDHFIYLVVSVPSGFYAVVGLVYLFWGWQLYRFTLTMAAALVGGVGTAIVAQTWGYPAFIPALVGGTVFALLAVPLQKVAVFILGGICGAGVGFISSSYFQSEAVFIFWALFGFLLLGGLAVRFFRPMVIVGTCITGAWSITHALAVFFRRLPPDASGMDMFAYPLSYVILFVCLFWLGVISQCWLSEEEVRPQPVPVGPPGRDGEQGQIGEEQS
ncbi:MAG: TMEM198/TM7SF3 family protein [Planctomycetes bacterium]|nr:TMEM198/TM7SF3 family protein [Planctomycetota bacterium]